MTGNDTDRRHHKLETILATLDEVMQLGDIDAVMRAIARGFVEIGAVMSIIMDHDGKELRVAGRWPEPAADSLYARIHGGSLTDFRIALNDDDNPYVVVYRSGQAKLMNGPEEVADHIIATYSADPGTRPVVVEALHGRAGAAIPLVAGQRTLGVAGVNYAEDLTEADRRMFSIFASSAATLLSFKRDVISKEAILAELERALDNERRTRAELNRAERLAALGEMSAVVAHEIRNPIAVISNSLTPLRRHLDDSESGSLLVNIVEEEAQRINRIIGSMLAFSSPIRAHGIRQHPNELVGRAVFLARQNSSEVPSKQLIIEAPEDLPLVIADADLATQALVNILTNACDAAPKDGRVQIRCCPIAWKERTYVRFAVTDDGEGIPAELRDQVYKPFFTTKASGTGLGLSIVKRIVDAHEGRIAIESPEGGGTTVSIDLPTTQ